ncbi:ABC transporter permease [Actinomyces oricola]|uniref:ABC transporter permease n=1 Tax=Actinomyces oricola TaxID=206043 RepID=UPI000FFEE415|nr:ABC transporter permease [Actinomyces oricola]
MTTSHLPAPDPAAIGAGAPPTAGTDGSAQGSPAASVPHSASVVCSLPTPGLAGRLRLALRQTVLLMRWQFSRAKALVPIYVAVQIMMALATVLGYKLLVGDPEPTAATYLATGAPTILLIALGLVMAPQWVAQSRTEGSLDWMRTLPVPRLSFLIADLAVWTLMALPGMLLGTLVGAWRLDVDLSPAWWLVPGVVMVSLTAASVGYAMANVLPPPLAQVMTQILIFVTMLFSPVSYPVERLPQWGQEIHRWLPIEPMAEVLRAGLVSEQFKMPLRSWAVLASWCVAAVVAALWALGSRPPAPSRA